MPLPITHQCRHAVLWFLCGVGAGCSFVLAAVAQQPAFPGAEGFGAYSTGGRSGTVYVVTNLNDSGAGSLRDGVSQPNRTIVFAVSGNIDLLSNLDIQTNNLTIAGQTAPGDGITLRGRRVAIKNTHDVIMRYVRARAGDTNCPSFQGDTFEIDSCQDTIVDHLSTSWSMDETCSVVDDSTNITVQWTMVTESLNNPSKCLRTDSHGYASLLRNSTGGYSFHHNLYAHHYSRNPRLGDNVHLDWVNNVLYNWQDQAGYNADDSADNPGGYTNYLNYVGNYLIGGTNTAFGTKISRAFQSNVPNPIFCQIHQSNNLMDTNRNGVLDGGDLGWTAFRGTFTTNTTRFASPQVSTDGPAAAYVRVLSSAGASVARDAVDARIVSNVISQTGAIISSQDQVGGWPSLNSLPAPADTDQDGVPDFWERVTGLNPDDPADRNGLSPNGYTQLEEYLNWLAAPHASVQGNSSVNVDLQQYTAGVQSPTYGVSGATTGTVALLGDGHTARFTPAPGFAGLANFQFTASGAPSGLTGTVSVLVTSANLVWRGDGVSNDWDLDTTANWFDGTNAVVTFWSGDNVTFDDAGSNSPAINLVGMLLPASVNVTATQDYTFGGSGSLGGTTSLVKSGPGRLTLTTSNTYSGGTTVNNGTLWVNSTTGSGTGTGAVTVASSAALGGNGLISGPVTVNGTLVPGDNGIGTLTIGNNLVLNSGAVSQVALGTNGALTAVSGNLALGGTLNVTDAGGFTSGTYILFTYGGTLICAGVTLSAAPAGYAYALSTATPGQVNLTVTATSSQYQQWQIDHFGSTLNFLGYPSADPDGDGQDNMTEFLTGTNPTNNLSSFRIISAARQGNAVAITWTTAGGRTNAVQAAPGDGNGGYTTNFTDLGEPLFITGSGDATTNYTDAGGATNSPSRFYRIRLAP
jgi:autotransporter-associated beta strand protein